MSPSRSKDSGASRTPHTDISLPGWWRLLPAAAHPYLLIARFDRPIGWWLLLLPGWWVIPLAATDPAAMIRLMVLFLTGAVTMRAAGCVVNDLWDRRLDQQVERTAARPLAAGTVSVIQALVFLALLCLVGPDKAEQCKEDQCLNHADGTGGKRSCRGAFHLLVQSPVPQIIDHASGGAHRDRAGQEQHHQTDHRSRISGGKRDHPPAWKQQQPPADWPVEPGNQQIGMCRGWQQPPPARKADIRMRRPAGAGIFASGW